uniref:Uncharacterized protein n=1 Tax=Anguilla anguilla TaxID=7936 RepID=A0A0E9X397_ANGAN
MASDQDSGCNGDGSQRHHAHDRDDDGAGHSLFFIICLRLFHTVNHPSIVNRRTMLSLDSEILQNTLIFDTSSTSFGPSSSSPRPQKVHRLLLPK